MTSPLVRMREMQAAMRELEESMKALQEDPNLRLDLEFENGLQALLSRYGKTIHEAVQVVDPTFIITTASKRPYNKRPPKLDAQGNVIKTKPKHAGPHTKYFLFTNPHTNEVVRAANILKAEVQEWIKKYGKDEVLSWKAEEQAA